MKTKNKILAGILLILLLIQFIRIDKTNPPVDSQYNFVDIYHPNENIEQMIKNACYDCHSNQTQYPWYSNVAPFSWMLKSHINEGREHLNFSEFGKYNAHQKAHVLEEAGEEVRKNKMPLSLYTWMHSEAKLSPEQRSQLSDYFENIVLEVED